MTYTRTRLLLDRAAWESLPSDGVLLLRIRPRGGQPFALALTRAELEETFGEVRETGSWDEVRCYHFAKLPPAAEAFRVTEL